MRSFAEMKVVIVGLGQMGGALAKVFTKRKIFAEIIGVDKNLRTIEKAKRLKIIHKGTTDLRKAIPQADLLILAVAVRQIIKMLPTVVSLMKKDAILCDVGSTKSEVLRAIENLKHKVDYIGLHPMAGTEKVGIDGADENLFVNKTIMVFPSKNTQKPSLKLVLSLIKKLKAKPLIMNVKKHDEIMAKISHLPYLFSIALVNLANSTDSKEVFKVLGGSFRDATRVSLSSPEMMLDILTTNKKNIISQINTLTFEILRYKKLLENGDEKKLLDKILKAKQIRNGLKLV
ncbi:MAG TPA: prephenate dehydrogenase [candidate division Zixibacteria bacterium]|nr:prephenate dehydrogenase [candidate division Zixibacteria bacterium]